MINAQLNGSLSTSFRVRSVNRKIICDICESGPKKTADRVQFDGMIFSASWFQQDK